MKEIWKAVSGYEGFYKISNCGRVKKTKKWDLNKKIYIPCNQILKPQDNSSGYKYIKFCKNGTKRNIYIHRLVALHFVKNPNNQNYVNHIDYDKSNNHFKNLEWCSQRENVLHSAEHMKKRKSVSHSNTGEMYISKIKRTNKYRVTVDCKQLGCFSSLKKAIDVRDNFIKKGVI